MIKRKSGPHNIQYFKKKASTAFINGALCNVDANGFLIPATATSINHVGTILKTIAATDSDYASTTMVPVDMAGTIEEFTAEVSAGTVAQTAVGAYYDLNSTGDKVDLSSTTTKQVYVKDINVAASTVTIIVSSTAGVDETGA